MKKLIIVLFIFLFSLMLSLNFAAAYIENNGGSLGSTTTNAAAYGMNISVGSQNVLLVNATKTSSTTKTTAQLWNSNKTLVKQVNFVGNNATFNVILNSSDIYYIVATGAGNLAYEIVSGIYPIAGTYINWEGALEGNTVDVTNRIYIFTEVDVYPATDITINGPANNSQFLIGEDINFNITSVTDSTLSNITLYIGGSCYQETANVTTECGGLDTGSYSFKSNYFYINYTKPASSGATWQVKHADYSTYNVTIPDTCFDYGNTLQLRFYGSNNGCLGYGQCYDGNWNNITNIRSGTCSCGAALDVTRRLYDGDYDTDILSSIVGDWTMRSLTDDCYSTVYEEGITWSVYNKSSNETKTISGTSNETIFTKSFEAGHYLWNVRMCNSDNTCITSAERNLTVSSAIINSQTYNPLTTSGAVNEFEIEIETLGDLITVAYLNYDGINNIASISSYGNIYNASINKTAKSVSATENVTFYWNITTSAGYNFVTGSLNQTVNPIPISSDCGAGTYTLFNFTLLDERTLLKINETALNSSLKIDLTVYTSNRALELTSFSHEFNRTNPVRICIGDNLSGGEQYSLDAQIQYSALDYSSEFYNIERYILNSSSLNKQISLLDLNSSYTQEFKLIVRDTSYLPIKDALIQIERKYIDKGTFNITEIPRTDENGITTASFELNDVIYNVYIYQYGILKYNFNNVIAICQNPLISPCEIDFNAFQTDIQIINFTSGDDFNFTIDYNSSSRTVLSYFVIPSGNPSTIRLEVIKEDTLGTSGCEDTLTAVSGTLSCLVPSNFGNATILVRLYKDGILQGKGNIKLGQRPSDIYGVILIMASVFVLITLIGIGISDNPVVTGIFLFIGVVLLFSMNLVANTGFIGATATILFLAIAIILVIIKAARRT